MQFCDPELETLNIELRKNPEALQKYVQKYDAYRPSALPRFFGNLLVLCGNIVYGKTPSYLKFRAVEVIARVPYHSWESAAYTLLTLFFTDEKRAMKLSEMSWFSRTAKENETMHVVVISHFARAEKVVSPIRGTMIPLMFAFVYFWGVYILYLVNPRHALELNYMFESHAFKQYSEFVETNKDALIAKSASSEYLSWYGRDVANQYEFFNSVRIDEIIHRNRSIELIEVGESAEHHS